MYGHQERTYVDIQDILVKIGAQYKKSGTKYFISCHRHKDNSPSLCIYQDTQRAYCYSCHTSFSLAQLLQEKGHDASSLLKSSDRLNISENIVNISSNAEISLPLYYKRLSAPYDKLYWSNEIISFFNIGLCEAGYSRSIDASKCKKCPFFTDIWIKSGNCLFSKKRYMVPVTSKNILYTIESRTVEDRDGVLKVVYPPGSKTGKTIFNLDSLDRASPLFLVEGIKSAIRLWAAGFKNVTAIFSNKLKGSQGEILSSFSHVIAIPDLGRAGKDLVYDLSSTGINKLEIVQIPYAIYCKHCKTRYRGEEGVTSCPKCGRVKNSLVDAFDLSDETLHSCVERRIPLRTYLEA